MQLKIWASRAARNICENILQEKFTRFQEIMTRSRTPSVNENSTSQLTKRMHFKINEDR